jgi:hypothetical protein
MVNEDIAMVIQDPIVKNNRSHYTVPDMLDSE